MNALMVGGREQSFINELMQTVCLRFPVPKHMLMCATLSNRWELTIVIGAGEGSVGGITTRSLKPVVDTRIYSNGVLRGK